MRRTVFRFAVFVTSFFMIALAARLVEGAGSRLTTKQYEQALRTFINKVDATYPFFELKGIRADWNACKRRILNKVRTCRKNDDFYGLLAEATRCLRDAHLFPGNLKGEFPESEPKFYPGLAFLPAKDGQVVVMSAVDEEAYDRELPPGCVVLTIDGWNARQLLEYHAQEIWEAGGSFSSRQHARLRAYRLPLRGEEDARHKLTVLRNGRQRTVTVKNKYRVGSWPRTYAMPEDLRQEEGCSYGTLKSGFGYIYLRHVGPQALKPIDKALARFRNTRGLIIDLRGSIGTGYREIIKRFDKRRRPTKGIPYFGGALVVLIDAGTIGTGETFARDLVYYADAHLMGSRSAGAARSGRNWRLPYGLGGVNLAVQSAVGFNNQPIEYYGIAPHELVEVVPAELQKGINSAIARAEEYLLKKAKERDAQ